MNRFILGLLGALLLTGPQAQAQTAQPVAIVVTTCDTAGFGRVGNSAPLTINTAGTLCTSSGGGGGGGTSSSFAAAFPATGTAAGFSDGTNMQGGRVYDTDSGAGSEYTLGSQIRAAASGGSVAIGGDVANGLDVDVTRVTGTVTVTGSGTAGSAAVGVVTVQGIASMTPILATVSDGSGALNVIVDSGTITAVTAITNALPAGTNAIGKLSANSGVDIGDVDVLTLGGQSPDYGGGATAANTLTTVLASDSPGIIATGTAGSPSATVLTVQGVASMTPLATQPAGSVAADGAAAGVNPVLGGCYASAAAPSDMSADNDSTREWCLRNGARATVITAAGALVGGDAANGLDVDVTRLSALVAGSAIIGNVRIDQTTPGTTNGTSLSQIGSTTVATGNGTVSGGVQRIAIADIGVGEYETVAASQTAQVLGATGATGDYLLQVVCAPATTSPGVVTVLDNATALVSFPGGASSVSNLIPFTITVNAYSTSGAWKLTTGANVSCVGVGNFL